MLSEAPAERPPAHDPTIALPTGRPTQAALTRHSATRGRPATDFKDEPQRSPGTAL